MFSHNPSQAFRLIYFFFSGSPSPPSDSSCWFLCMHLLPSCARAAIGVVARVHLAGELIWLEITVVFRQVIFHLGQFPDPVLCVASGPRACTTGGTVPEQGRAPQGGRGCLTWAAARYLAATCSHANHTSEDGAATVYAAPGKR